MAPLNKRFNNPFIAFQNSNFRYYWAGWMVSLIGTWMQNIAQPWLAYTLTNSPFLLGLVSALQFTPTLFLSLFAGAILDRFSKRKILLLTQAASLIITLIPTVLIWTHTIQFWHILVLASIIGIINSIDMPARQSFVVEIVGKENTLNAVALTSATFNSARLLGPAIAGIIMARFGIGWCYFINALSFGALLLALIFIKTAPSHRPANRFGNVFADVKEGLAYVRNNDTILKTLMVVAVGATFGMNYQVLVPVFTKMVLHGEERSFGFLISCVGAGSLCGSLNVALMSKHGPRRFNLVVAPIMVGIMFVCMAVIPASFAAYAACLIVSGFFFVSFSSSSNSTVQISANNQFRGRVMSMYTLVFSGSAPIGGLFSGFFSGHFGPRIGYLACGSAILILTSSIFAFRLTKSKRIAKLRLPEKKPYRA